MQHILSDQELRELQSFKDKHDQLIRLMTIIYRMTSLLSNDQLKILNNLGNYLMDNLQDGKTLETIEKFEKVLDIYHVSKNT